MIFDGNIEPDTIVIQMPTLVIEKFTNQFEELGMRYDEARAAAARLIEKRIGKYIPAGSPVVVIDEYNRFYESISFPVNQNLPE
jgi:hypothetical protein